MNRLALASALALSVALAGCETIAEAPAGPFAMGDGKAVTLHRAWSDVSILSPQRQKKVRLLSIDGPALNLLYLAQGLAPGEGLLKPASKAERVPVYRADMSPNELVEFVTDSLSALGYEKAQTSKLRPGRLVGADGLRMDIAAYTQDGLEISGLGQISEAGGKLYVALYLAPTEHYFAATLPDVDAMLGGD
ncbi:hypothetical protein [Phenylobacterium immobile]|uniref:hypothetical protein n=1 Tax=Phenylobacterium immobile TaxID=21 RepID=UPI000AB82358|nr:hypothetical protein [Phenylobacterium immobile]